jgi:transcriptional regulator with XRE-family HTH domain
MGKRVRDLHAPEYQQARKLVYEVTKLRLGEKLTQGVVNKRSGYSQSGLSEWEAFKMPNYALVTLIRIAKAIGYKVNVTFEKEEQ